MSPRLPVVGDRDVVRVATKLGFVFDHQRGSHAVYYRQNGRARVVILMHSGKDLKPKTLESMLDIMELKGVLSFWSPDGESGRRRGVGTKNLG